MSKRLGLKIAPKRKQQEEDEEEEPMSPTLTKVVEMERERDEVLEAMEQGEFDEEEEMEVLHQIAQLQQQIEDLMKKRMKRIKGKGKARSPTPELAQPDEDEEDEEVEVTLASDDEEDPTVEGEDPVGALANGEVWVFAAVNLDTGDMIAAHAPENWLDDKGFKRRVTLVAGTVKVSRSKTSGKPFPSKVLEFETVRKVKRDMAIEWFEDHLDEEGFTEFNDKKGNNYVIKLLENAENA